MPLKALPKTFGLTEQNKGNFPHLFNRLENQDDVGSVPPIENYDTNGMSKKKKRRIPRLAPRTSKQEPCL